MQKKSFRRLQTKLKHTSSADLKLLQRVTRIKKNYLETQEGKMLPVVHCVEGTEDWQVVPKIAALCDTFINKPTFGFKDWQKELSDVEEIHLCGTCTAICVASNFSILKAAFPEVPIYVHQNLCACLTSETNQAALTVMKCQQAILV